MLEGLLYDIDDVYDFSSLAGDIRIPTSCNLSDILTSL